NTVDATADLQNVNGGQWLRIGSQHCAQGGRIILQTIPGKVYTVSLDLDFGDVTKVNFLGWGVDYMCGGSGTSYMGVFHSVTKSTANIVNVSFTFTATQCYTLLQIRKDHCVSSWQYFYIDNVSITYPDQVVQKMGRKGYKYGFNGQEKDNEVYGDGNSYTAEFWQYDPRLGRRWNVDPLASD